MIVNQPKAELIFEINARQREETCQKLQKLLILMRDEIRIDNDTATRLHFMRNQGKIAVITQILEYITRGLPTTTKLS